MRDRLRSDVAAGAHAKVYVASSLGVFEIQLPVGVPVLGWSAQAVVAASILAIIVFARLRS